MASPDAPTGYDAVIRSLKAHARTQTGPVESEFDALVEAFERETDRGAVILLATLFEDKLTGHLEGAMRPLRGEERKGLFGFDAPLGTFSRKIRVASALSLMTPGMTKVANVMREMRNACAHSRQAISFKDSALADGVALIAQITGYAGVPLDTPEKCRFIFLLFVNWLIVSLETGGKPGLSEHVSELMNSYAKRVGRQAETGKFPGWLAPPPDPSGPIA